MTAGAVDSWRVPYRTTQSHDSIRPLHPTPCHHMIDAWFRPPKILNEDDPRRFELTRLARDRRRRVAKSTTTRPARWQPASVHNPDDGNSEFTNDGAWELIASQLESGHRVEIMALDKPKGATGYVMKIRLDNSHPQLYV